MSDRWIFRPYDGSYYLRDEDWCLAQVWPRNGVWRARVDTMESRAPHAPTASFGQTREFGSSSDARQWAEGQMQP